MLILSSPDLRFGKSVSEQKVKWKENWKNVHFDIPYTRYRQYEILFTSLYVCLSVRDVEVYCDHIGWNTSKIISRLVSLRWSLFAEPNITDLFQGEHPEIVTWIGVRYGKSGIRRTKTLISEAPQDMTKVRLLLATNRKSYTRFRLLSNSTTWTTLKGHYALFQSMHHGVVN